MMISIAKENILRAWNVFLPCLPCCGCCHCCCRCGSCIHSCCCCCLLLLIEVEVLLNLLTFTVLVTWSKCIYVTCHHQLINSLSNYNFHNDNNNSNSMNTTITATTTTTITTTNDGKPCFFFLKKNYLSLTLIYTRLAFTLLGASGIFFSLFFCWLY